MTQLQQAQDHGDPPDYFHFPQLKIHAATEKSLPEWEDFLLISDENADWEQFEEDRRLLVAEETPEIPDISSKLLGWPDIIQDNMTQECELIRRNYYLGSGWHDIPTKDTEAAAATSIDVWRLWESVLFYSS